MNPLSTKSNVVANIKNGKYFTTGPGLPPCRHLLNDNHVRTRLETRRSQKRKSLEKNLDLGINHMVHEKSTKQKNMAY